MLTVERLHEIIHYDPETGIATWRMRPCKYSTRALIGGRVGFIMFGSKRSKPYRYVRFKELGPIRKPFTHLVVFYMTGHWPDGEVDHIHGDTLDDRWSEIRECTRAQNEANRGPRKNNRLGVRGVYPYGGRYAAAIMRNRKRVWIGLFATLEAATEAYLIEAKRHDGEFLRAA